jgi:putative MATE family efflux protein
MSGPPDDPRDEVEREVEELEDPEAGGAIPSAALAGHAGTPSHAARRATDRAIWGLAWPAIASQTLGSAVGLIDIAMIGRIGTDALAAAGYVTQYLFLSQSLLFALGAACVALMGRALGAERHDEARSVLAGSMLLAVGTAAILSTAVLAFPAPLLAVLDAPPGVIEIAIPYFRLTIGASILLAIPLTYESAFRAARDTLTPLAISAAVTGSKVVLNAVLIFGLFGVPALGLEGAGWATLGSIALALAIFPLAAARSRASRALRLRRSDLAASASALPELVRVSFPAVAERVVLNAAVMAFFAMLGHYGTAAVAAYTIGVRVLSFSWIPPSGFSIASATLVAHALGAGDTRGAARAGWRAARLALGVSTVLGLGFALAREPLARIFTDDTAVIAAMGPFMLFLALSQPVMGVHFTLGGALRGAGDTITPLLAAGLGNWGLRVPIAFLCSRVLEVDLIWVWTGLVGDHLARAAWLVWAFRRGRWSPAQRPS